MQILWLVNKEMDISTSRTVLIAMAEQLQRLGHQVTLLARYRHKAWVLHENSHIIYLPSLNRRGLRSLTFLASLWTWLPLYLQRARPDVVIIDRPLLVWALLPWLLLSRLLWAPVRWVLDVRSAPIERRGLEGKLWNKSYHIGLWFAGRLMHGWTTITPALSEQISRLGGIPKERIGIWSSGVDCSIFSPQGKHKPQDWPFDEPFVIIYHGVVSTDRALDEVIKALGMIRDQVPDLSLFLLGDGHDRQALIDLTESLGLVSRVIFHEPVPYTSVPDYLASANVGLVPLPDTPSYRVSSPLKLIEYLAMGKPVVITDIQAHRSILRGRGDAIYVPCVSNGRPTPEALSHAMLQAYRQFANLSLSTENRRIVLEEYNWTVQAHRLEAYCLALREADAAR